MRQGDTVTRTDGDLEGLEAKVLNPCIRINHENLVEIRFKDSRHKYIYPIDALRKVR